MPAFCFLITNEKVDNYVVAVNTVDADPAKMHAINQLADKKIDRNSISTDWSPWLGLIFGNKQSDYVLAVTIRYMIGTEYPLGEGHVDFVVRKDDGSKDIVMRIYDRAPCYNDEYFFDFLGKLSTHFLNPAVRFADDAKQGKYNDLSDEDYAKRLDIVKHKSKFFDDKRDVPFSDLLANYAQVVYLCRGMTLKSAHHTGHIYKCSSDSEDREINTADNSVNDDISSGERTIKPLVPFDMPDNIESISPESDGIETLPDDLFDDEASPEPIVFDTDAGKEAFENALNKALAIKKPAYGNSDIEFFLDEVSFSEFYNEIKEYVIGHDEEIKKACYYVYSHLKAVSYANDIFEMHNNFMITGRSGCGKTEFYRALSKVFRRHRFDYKVMFLNIGSITPEGYRGVNLSMSMMDFYKNNPEGNGIIFLDEIDKKICGSMGYHHDFDNQGVYDLLTVLDGDGIEVIVDKMAGTVSHFPTDKILFIGLGAFANIRDMKTSDSSALGFTAMTEKERTNLYADNITADDIAEAGGLQEFLGRFCDIINFKSLSDNEIRVILKQKLDREFINNDVSPVKKINISDDVISQLVDIANDRRGVRAMVGTVKSIVADSVINAWMEGKQGDMAITIESTDPVKVKVRTIPKTASRKSKKKMRKQTS